MHPPHIAGIAPTYPALFETEFKRPTLLPARLRCAWELQAFVSAKDGAARLAGAQAAASSQAGLAFAVVTDDQPAKDVIVGRLAVARQR